nr:copia protein [Tanacetum cinerariifolium]
MSANDKFGLGYGDYRYGSILSYDNEVLQSVFMNKECDLKNTPVNDRYAEGMHTVPPPMIGNYMPSGPDVEIDYSKFTYVVNESKAVSEPKAICEPKVWIDSPIIEEYESDSDDDSVSNVQKNIEKPSFAFTNSVKHVKSPKENVKQTGTPNHYLKIQKQDRHSHTRKGLGYARKSCFVCGSFSHLITDCDFYEKRMAKQAALTKIKEKDDPHKALKDKGIVDSGCSRHMTGNKAHLVNYKEFKGGSVTFGGSNGKITGKGKIKADRLDFEDVYYVEELKHYNLFSVSQIRDKKNKVLFTNTDCLVLPPNFKLPDENQVHLKIPRQHNMYSFNLKNIDPSGDLSCLFVKALIDESYKWHRRLGHVNLKNLNKLVKGNLVRGLHSKIFENDHTCVACQKGKQHKASCPQEANNSAGTQANDDQSTTSEEIDLHDEHFVMPMWSAYSITIKSLNDKIQKTTDYKTSEKPDANTNNTNLLNAVSAPVSAVSPSRALDDDEPSYPNDPSMPHIEDIYASASAEIFTDSFYDDEGVVTDFNNVETTFQIQKVWILVDLPFGKKAIGTKWVYRNKKDERGVVVRNKERLVAQGHRQEEKIDYDEVFTPVARIEAIRIFLAFGSYMGVIVYQMDVKSAFLYGTINEEVYVTQPPGFIDPKFLNKVYKVVKALYGLHQAHRAWYATLSTFLEKSGYRRGAIDTTLFIKQDKKDIMLVQVYVDDIIFGSTKKSWCDEFKELMKNSVKTASTLIKTHKPLVKDKEVADVDVYLYRDAYEKKLIQVLKIHTDDNVADLLMEAFDVSRFKFLVVNIRLLNLYLHCLRRGYLKLLLLSIEVTLDLKSSCWDRRFLCVGFHTIPQLVINSPCLTHIKNWLVQEKTALGKDFSNPFMADNLQNII